MVGGQGYRTRLDWEGQGHWLHVTVWSETKYCWSVSGGQLLIICEKSGTFKFV